MLQSSTAREIDDNGFITIAKNPISKSGVFQYLGKNLPGADPDRIYNVWRPAEELNNPDTLKSFQLLPLIDDHAMLGENYGLAAEDKGVHGSTGENIIFEDNVLYSSLRIFSEFLKEKLDQGKIALSMGLRCAYEKASGVVNGEHYDYIQRNIRGNHIALVDEGRMGRDVVVLDSMAFDHFDLALDTGDTNMADTEENKTDTEEKKAMTLEDACAMLEKIVPMVEKLNAAMVVKAEANDDDGVAAEEANSDTALDEDTEEESGDNTAMDAAEINKRFAALEKRSNLSEKELLKNISNRNALANELSYIVGAFDHAEMTTDEVAKYGLKKLNLTASKGQEHAVLQGFMQGRKAATNDTIGYAMDSRSTDTDSLLDKRMASHQA